MAERNSTDNFEIAGKQYYEQSDYGSDFDTDGEQIVTELLSEFDASAVGPLVREGLEENVLTNLARVPRYPSQKSSQDSKTQTESGHHRGTVSLVHVDRLEGTDDVISHFALARGIEATQENVAIEVGKEDESENKVMSTSGEATMLSQQSKSPLEIFRTAPSKPLSVSDFVGPSWCEVQYWYSLVKYGKKRRTRAMKRGGEVHRTLELEVHEFVPVEVQTKEDAWGLRLWNVIQGLRALRTTGMTRELDVWGVIDGQVVAGIIDELSFSCPDPELEMAIEQSKENLSTPVPPNQMTITNFYSSPNSKGREVIDKIYITDTKTRTTNTLPGKSSLRPTQMQLMFYHHLVTLLSENEVPGQAIFSCYKLDSEKTFTKAFLSAIHDLESNSSAADNETGFPPSSAATSTSHYGHASELDLHSNLDSLWSLMMQEYRITFPAGALSPILHASFRSQTDGSMIGSRTFVYDEDMLRRFALDQLGWWKGERPPRGVDVEETFKCRVCEFADECNWRQEKEEEARARFRSKRQTKKKSREAGSMEK